MYEIRRVAYLPTICLTHILEKIKDTSSIIEMDAYRGFYDESTARLKTIFPDLPFLKKRTRIWKSLDMRFRGRFRALVKHDYGIFPVNKILQVLNDEEYTDMAISRMIVLSRDENLWNMFEASSKTATMIPKERMIILNFVSNSPVARQDYLRREVLNVMKNQVEKLGFKASILDLTSVETYPDWKYQVKNNLLQPTFEKSILKDMMYSVFKPDGIKVRAYRLTEKKTWELVEVGDL